MLDLRTGDADHDQLDHADAWGLGTRVVRSRVLEVLLLGERADWPLHHRGLALVGARIDGELNLNYGTVAAPIEFDGCFFDQPITMVGSALSALRAWSRIASMSPAAYA